MKKVFFIVITFAILSAMFFQTTSGWAQNPAPTATASPTPRWWDDFDKIDGNGNQSPLKANTLVPNYQYKGLNIGPGDIDWYVVNLTQGYYDVKLGTSSRAVAPKMFVYSDHTGATCTDADYDEKEPSNSHPNLIARVTPRVDGTLDVVSLNISGSSKSIFFCITGVNPSVDYTEYGSYSLFVEGVIPTVVPTKTPTPTPTKTPVPGGVNDVYDKPPKSNNTPETAVEIVPGADLKDLTLTPGDNDYFKASVSKGKYAAVITTSSGAVDPDMVVTVIHKDGRKDVYKRVNDGGPVNPSIQIETSGDATILFQIYGNKSHIDYSLYGTYNFSFSFIPEMRGVEDHLEPNNTAENASIIGYDQIINDLTIYSTILNPDEDYFTFVAPQAMDLHCDATSDNSMLDLSISGHIAGAPDFGPKIRPEIYTNYNGNNPRIVLHNIPSGTQIIFKVSLENPAVTNPSAGSIKYSFGCQSGTGKSSPSPKPTKKPGNPKPTSYEPKDTPVPTPTPLPQSIPFVARLSSSVQPTPVVNVPNITSYRFVVFADLNGNRSPDLDEYISGLKIFIQDVVTNQIRAIETNNGQITYPLTGNPSQFRYIIPALGINAEFPKDNSNLPYVELKFEAPSFTYSSVIP
jgi:hypothetical protein